MSRLFAIAALAVAFTQTTDAQAQGVYRQIIGDGGHHHHQVGQFSPRLKAYFTIERVHAAGQCFVAAKLVSNPLPGSPLNQAGLQRGDIITRLDNVRVTSFYELENHYALTTVRFFCTVDGDFENSSMYIDTHDHGHGHLHTGYGTP